MAVQFKPKPGKPHIKIRKDCLGRIYLWPDSGDYITPDYAVRYCTQVNPLVYTTSGDAARALHYWSANK